MKNTQWILLSSFLLFEISFYMAFYQLKTIQYIPATLDQVWDFVSSPGNLKTITPPHMGFTITSGEVPEKMYPGMIISYKVSPVPGIRVLWVTEITQVREKEFFVDEQRAGPYSMWHHEHNLKPVDGGVLMTDIVSYRPPLGFLGALANRLFIKKQLKKIFDYRSQELVKLFGEYTL